MKISKKVISMLLVAIMVLSNFAGLGGIDFDFAVEADAAVEDTYQTQYDPTDMNTSITLSDGDWGVTQQRVVSDYQSVYDGYRERFFTGRESNEPTNFVIPGLSAADDFVTQGMTYWAEKDWFLISSYYDGDVDRNSIIMAIDCKTAKFVALFKLQNADGSMNTSHGGGIAASEYNFYYADSGSTISYVPLSELDVPNGTVKYLTMKGTVDFAGEMKGVSTSYCCYDEGYLWAGNFYRSGSDYDDDYTSDYPSVLVGYQLKGESSEEEWYYLQNPTNLVSVNSESAKTVNSKSYNVTTETDNGDGTTTSNTTAYTQSMTYTASSTTSQDTGAMSVSISGSISGVDNSDNADGGAVAKPGEFIATYGSLSLIEGETYTISFKSTNNKSDMYLFAPNGTHCNVKQASTSSIVDNGDGTYTYSMTFVAGVKPYGADSSWPDVQSIDGTYTGRYTIRFDQDNPSDGSFTISDIKVVPVSYKETKGYAGEPSELVVFGGGLDNIQYAIVHEGKVYLSRSWGRGGTVYELVIGEMDLGVPGEVSLSINGTTRSCHLINASTDLTRFGNDQMFLMSEAICIVDNYLYMDMESACNKYMNGTVLEGGKCDEPIDVIWRIDQREILNEYREVDEASAAYYEKIYDISKLSETDEVILVHKSNITDSFTQLPILYALDSTGGYSGNYLPKQDVSTASVIGDNFGMIGKAINSYSYDGDGEDILIISEEDDAHKGMRWRISDPTDTSSTGFRLENLHPYFSSYKYLYFGSKALTMSTNNRSALYNLKLEAYNDEGDFRFYYQSLKEDGVTYNNPYYLWCNDGSDQTINNIYNRYYNGGHGITAYTPTYDGCTEIPGTFHTDAELLSSGSSSNASGNLTGEAVPVDYQLFNVYRRVRDSYSSTYDSRIYTDLTADLQADGTYNINMETYAINKRPLVPTETKPTDFVLVLDTSGSMQNSDYKVLQYYYAADGNTIKASRIAREDGNSEYGDLYKRDTEYVKQCAGNIYYVASDGTTHLLYVDFQTPNDATTSGFLGIGFKYTTYIWIYYIDGGYTYYLQSDGSWITSTTRPGTDSCSLASEHSSQDSRGDSATFAIDHAAYDQGETRLKGMQDTVCDFIDEVFADSTEHRIALVQYGSDANESYLNTGYFKNSSTTMVGFNPDSSDYTETFFNSSQAQTLKDIVNAFVVTQTDPDPDTYVNHGFTMAKGILENSGYAYISNGENSTGARSAAVIMMTDGVPGAGANSSDNDTTANAAILTSNAIKNDIGGFVYSVQLGDASGDYANMGKYLDYVSSEYPDALSLTESGDPDIQEITYHHDVKFGDVSLTNLVSNMFVDIKNNSTNSVAVLESNTIIKEHISDNFVIPEGTEIKVYTADAYYDQLKRLQFDEDLVETTAYNATISKDSNGEYKIIQVNGFDYSTEYVSVNRPGLSGNGRKLIVSIKGVLPKETDDLMNAPINIDAQTGIYEDETHVANEDPVKRFPVSYFSIPEYTYVLDYNLPMRDTDVNGEPLAISPNLTAQDVNNYNKSLAAAGVTDGVGLEIENNSEGVGDNLIYSLKGVDDGELTDNKGYVLIKRDDGTYDWFRINIVPASNVMYEESAFTQSGSGVEWSDDGTTINTHQSLSTQYDVYGYDDRFDYGNDYLSNGTGKKVIVDSTNKRSKTQTFEFTGDGFDLVSACGPTTGIQMVSIRKYNESTGNYDFVKILNVDTYFSGETYGELKQVPVVSYKGEYGKYKVDVSAAYLSYANAIQPKSFSTSLLGNGTGIVAKSAALPEMDEIYKELGFDEYIGVENETIWMDDNSIFNGGTGVQSSKASRAIAGGGQTQLVNYLDGIRIYNPLGDHQEEYITSERGATYYNIMQSLASTEDITNGMLASNGSTEFVGFGEIGANQTFTFTDYLNTSAPKNEIYLSGGSNEAITFKVHEAANVMVSMRAVSGQTTPTINGHVFGVNSATEMYYDITPYLGEAVDGYYTVAVSNTAAGTLMAINNIKIVSGGIASPSGLATLSLDDAPQVASLMSLEPVEVEANAPKAFVTKYPDYVPTEKVEETDPEILYGSSGEYYGDNSSDSDSGFDFDFGTDDEFVSMIINMLFEIIQKIASFFAA